MHGDALGGGVVVALAAALWLAYLVPLWRRRRAFVATERNAVRLQQTLRILAETSEVPEEVRLEASVRVAAEQQRALRRVEEELAEKARVEADEMARVQREAEQSAAQAVAREQAALAAMAARTSTLTAGKRARALNAEQARRKRGRMFSTLLLAVSILGLALGLRAALLTGVWLLPLVSVLLGVVAVVFLTRLARPRTASSVSAPVPVRTVSSTEVFDQGSVRAPAVVRPATVWTPRPLPKPLHLSPGTMAASAMASVDAAAQVRRDQERAVMEKRAETLTRSTENPEVRYSPEPNPGATPVESQYARMGVVDDVQAPAMDIDAVLRRRRAAS